MRLPCLVHDALNDFVQVGRFQRRPVLVTELLKAVDQLRRMLDKRAQVSRAFGRRLSFLPALHRAPVHVHAAGELLVRPAVREPRFTDPLPNRFRRQGHPLWLCRTDRTFKCRVRWHVIF